MQMQVQQQAASVSVADVPIPDVGQPMDVDDPSISRDRGMKRRAEEELHEEGSKKAKTGVFICLEVSLVADGILFEKSRNLHL